MLLTIFQVICPDMYLAISQALINLVRRRSFKSKEQIFSLMCYYKCLFLITCSHWAADFPPLRVWILLPQLWHLLTTTAVQLWPLSQAPLWVIFYQLLSYLRNLSMSLTCFISPSPELCASGLQVLPCHLRCRLPVAPGQLIHSKLCQCESCRSHKFRLSPEEIGLPVDILMFVECRLVTLCAEAQSFFNPTHPMPMSQQLVPTQALWRKKMNPPG